MTATPSKSRRGRSRAASPALGAIDPGHADSAERQIYGLVKRAIMAGVFAPNAGMTSRSLAEGFGVSATPVREALKRLEADGVLQGRRNSAYFLTALTRESYREILEIRLRLEGYAAGEAARRAADRDIAALTRINEAYSRSGDDVRDGLRLNHRFHFAIYRLAQSPILLGLIENLWVRIGPALHYHLQGYDLVQVTDNHLRIIEALGRRDPQAAEAALHRDLTEAAAVIAPQLPERAIDHPQRPAGYARSEQGAA